MTIDMSNKQQQMNIICKFEEIDDYDGSVLIQEIINKYYDIKLLKKIITSLSMNKHKQTYQIYDYIIRYTEITYDTNISIYNYKMVHLASMHNNIYLLKYLIRNNIDVSFKDYSGRTAYDYANSEECKKIIEDYKKK